MSQFARFGHTGVNAGFESAMVAYTGYGKGIVIMVNANGASTVFDEVKGSAARAFEWPAFPMRAQVDATVAPHE